MKANKTEHDVLVWLACTAHGSDVTDKTYGVMAEAMKEHLDELGFVIAPKENSKLIAAAPEMLKAIKEAHIHALLDENHNRELILMLWGIISKLEASPDVHSTEKNK